MPESPSIIQLQDLVELKNAPAPAAAFHIAPRQQAGRWPVQLLPTLSPNPLKHRGWWAVPGELCGDAPHKYHPKYLMAVLSTPLPEETSNTSDIGAKHPPIWPVPKIEFTTDESVRRSMALNGMRMSLEYFESGSLRVLQLIEQRLAAEQRDIVHDVLVYLMQKVLDIRSQSQEARLLRAEALAAYLGLEQERVNHLLLSSRLSPGQIAAQIENGYAGPVRRTIDVPALVESQLEHLRPTLRQYQAQQKQALWLLDEVMRLLRQSR